jgi:hypothetical protein
MTKMVLYVHGVNVNEKDSGWQPGWTQAIETGFTQAGSQVQIEPYENEYRARLPAARLIAFGATRREAGRNLKDLASATDGDVYVRRSGPTGPGPARQFKALQSLPGRAVGRCWLR